MGQLRRLARSDVERAPNERGSRRQLVRRRDRRRASAEVPSTKRCEPGVPGRPAGPLGVEMIRPLRGILWTNTIISVELLGAQVPTRLDLVRPS
jgi:hypothetical protein